MTTPPPSPNARVNVHYLGHRFLLGTTASQQYAIWRRDGTEDVADPIAIYPATPAGWATASTQYQEWEYLPVAQARSGPAPSRRYFAVPFSVIVLIGVYVAVHFYVYRNCIFTPSLTTWPKACL